MGDNYSFTSPNDNPIENIKEKELKYQISSLKSINFFHGIIEREDAEKQIITNGEYLLRLSHNNGSKFVVSTKWNGKYLHVVIKHEMDYQKKLLMYYIVPSFKFPTIIDLMNFHKTQQYPLSNTSGAVLFRAVTVSGNFNKKEPKFRKSMHALRKPHSKAIPRSGSEMLLASQRYSADLPDLNKSLSQLPITDSSAPSKPGKPSFRMASNKLVLSRQRPSNINIRNEKLYKESGDYSDYSQLQDSKAALEREKVRRGLSQLGVSSPSLFGFSRSVEKYDRTSSSKENIGTYLPKRRESDSVYVAPSNHTVMERSSARITSKSATNISCYSYSKEDIGDTDSTNNIVRLNSVDQSQYVIPITTRAVTPLSSSLGSFLNLSLSSFPLSCCGPVEVAFDTAAINKAASYLLSHGNNPLALCSHLLEEIHRIFSVMSSNITSYKVGYRSLFIIGSEQCQKDLSIRQTALTQFIMATIVSTPSNDKGIKLILFWIKCADILLTNLRDMFHFRSVVNAIFSEEIINLKVWKILYKSNPSIKSQIQSLRQAISDGCFMRTKIDECIPDIVQLYSVFIGDDYEEDFEGFCQLCTDVMCWSAQSFDEGSTRLSKMCKELSAVTTIPFLRELVQTETLLSLILGRNVISSKDIDLLMNKVQKSLKVMADQRNDDI